MVMERKELEKKLTNFQAHSRGYLLRREVRRARADFEDLVREIDGSLNHLQWRNGIVSIPHFTDTDGTLPENICYKSPPAPKLHCLETHPPEHLLAKTEGEPHHQLFPDKIEAERDGLHLQKHPHPPRPCSLEGRVHGQVGRSHSHHDSRGSLGDPTTSTGWGSEDLDTHFPPSPQGSQHTQDVPLTQEALCRHRNTLSMELLWLQQAITSRKKYLSLKQKLSAP